jgi:hypothetical protein
VICVHVGLEVSVFLSAFVTTSAPFVNVGAAANEMTVELVSVHAIATINSVILRSVRGVSTRAPRETDV